jgi:GT2 family glycosyltransferase
MNYGVSIVIPTYNGLSLIQDNLPTVLNASRNPSNHIIEILVVDDGSTDRTSEFLKRVPEVRLIRHSKNRGFSASVNTGVRMCKGDLVVLLNNDVKVERDFLVSALPYFDDKSVFGVSFHEKGYGPSKGKFEDGFIVHEGLKETGTPQWTFWLSGGSSIIKRDIYMRLGGLDEELFSPFYWEDIDLSYRALKRGYKLIWDPKANVVHEHESTTGRIPKRYRLRIQERNQLLFIWKNLTSSRYLRRHIVGLFKRVVKSPGYLLILLMAIRKIGIVAKKRKKEIKEGKISDEAIFSTFV